MFDAILFDLDGTLTDPAEGITNSVAYALRRYGVEVPDRRELYRFIGPPLIYSFTTYYGFSERQATEAVDVYREYFKERGIFENVPYGGVCDMLDGLAKAGKRCFIATSKPEVFARRIAEHFGFERLLCGIYGIPLDGEDMSKAEVIAKAIECEGLDKAHTVMVGDRSYDADGARDNGIPFIGVTYGYGGAEEFGGAYAVADTVAELAEILKEA